MAGELVKVDTRELDSFAKSLEKAASKDVGAFLEKCAKELAIRVLRRTIQKTPKDTGNLQRGWTADQGTPECSEWGSRTTPEQWASTALIEKKDGQYQITISNPIEYSVYVEYGHRTPDLMGWVPGKFMMTLSINEVEAMQIGILQKLLLEFLGGLF